MNDAYNHKGTLEILINVGDSLVQAVNQQHENEGENISLITSFF